MHNTYQNAVDISKVSNKESKDALMRLVEMGMTPHQVLFTEAKGRPDKSNFPDTQIMQVKGPQLFQNSKLSQITIPMKKFEQLSQMSSSSFFSSSITPSTKPLVTKIQILDFERILVINSTRSYSIIKISQVLKDTKVSNETKFQNIKGDSFNYKPNFEMSYVHPSKSMIMYNNCQNIIRCGYWDGRIEISLNTKYIQNVNTGFEDYESISLYEKQNSPVVVMKMNQEETILICGKKNGLINVYKVTKLELKLIVSYFHHSDEVTSISLNNTLNMFATSSYDGYVNIYTLPACNFVR